MFIKNFNKNFFNKKKIIILKLFNKKYIYFHIFFIFLFLKKTYIKYIKNKNKNLRKKLL